MSKSLVQRAFQLSQAAWYAPAGMGQTAATPHSLATASGLLLGTTAVCMALGALIGWAAGSAGVCLLVGAIVGIPASVAVVYKVYSGGGA